MFISGIITPVFSVTRSFRNHYNVLIYSAIIIIGAQVIIMVLMLGTWETFIGNIVFCCLVFYLFEETVMLFTGFVGGVAQTSRL